MCFITLLAKKQWFIVHRPRSPNCKTVVETICAKYVLFDRDLRCYIYKPTHRVRAMETGGYAAAESLPKWPSNAEGAPQVAATALKGTLCHSRGVDTYN